nr:MAG TPA: hypothetical protein [Caudoviricetes sp.]
MTDYCNKEQKCSYFFCKFLGGRQDNGKYKL